VLRLLALNLAFPCAACCLACLARLRWPRSPLPAAAYAALHRAPLLPLGRPAATRCAPRICTIASWCCSNRLGFSLLVAWLSSGPSRFLPFCLAMPSPASNLRAGVLETLNELRRDLHELTASLQTLQVRRDKRTASKASKTFAARALKSAHFGLRVELARAEPVHVPPFNWRPGGREADLPEAEATDGGAYEGGSYAGLLHHLQMATPAALQLELRFEDVRHEKFTYEAHVRSDGSPGGVTVVDGFADSVFALRPAAAEVAFTWGCVVIDWKTPTAIAIESKVAAQVIMEMLAFAASTRRKGPVLFVATDLRDRMRVWQLEGRTITEFRGVGEAFLSVSEGFGVVCAMLPACIAACKRWFERLRHLRSWPEGGSDDDDDGADGPDDDDVEHGKDFAGAGRDAEVRAAAGAGAPAPPASATPQRGQRGRGSGRRGRHCGLAENAATSTGAAPDSPRSTAPLSPRSVHLYNDLARHKKAERLLALTRLLPPELGIENVSVEF